MNAKELLSRTTIREGHLEPCYAFSIHKCGSTMMHAMLQDVTDRCDLPGVSIPDLLFSHGIFENEWQADYSILSEFDRRSIYFGFRNLPKIFTDIEFRLSSRRFALLVRDPRDALVSQYFSYGKKEGSHNLPTNNPEAYEKLRNGHKETEIDQYVLEHVYNIKDKLIDYRDNLNFELGIVHRYEEVFYDKERFLRDLLLHLISKYRMQLFPRW